MVTEKSGIREKWLPRKVGIENSGHGPVFLENSGLREQWSCRKVGLEKIRQSESGHWKQWVRHISAYVTNGILIIRILAYLVL